MAKRLWMRLGLSGSIDNYGLSVVIYGGRVHGVHQIFYAVELYTTLRYCSGYSRVVLYRTGRVGKCSRGHVLVSHRPFVHD